MVFRILLALGVLALIILLLRWFVRTPPRKVANALRKLGLFALVGILVYLAATGRLHWLYTIIGTLLGAVFAFAQRLFPWLLRLLPFLPSLISRYKAAQAARGPKTGRQSQVATQFLKMTLDHDTGEMDGEVLAGAFQGQTLSDLDMEQLVALLNECREHDEESVALLQAYLDRVHGDTWREQAQFDGQTAHDGAGNGAFRSAMTTGEAYEILGVSANASEQEIIEAHRRLMQRLHPDRGGSTYLAAKINQAKETLLKKSA